MTSETTPRSDLTPQHYTHTILDNPHKARFWYDYERTRQVDTREDILTIENMINGEPPQDQDELDAAGLGYLMNKNFGEGRFNTRSVEFTYWALNNEVKTLGEFNLILPPPSDDEAPSNGKAPIIQVWEETLDEAFHKAITSWDKFNRSRALIGSYLAKFGSALAICDMPGSWNFKVPHNINITLPSDTKNFVSDWYTLAVVNHYTPEELWAIYYNEKSYDIGWDKEALRELLWASSSLYNADIPYSPGEFSTLESSIHTEGSIADGKGLRDFYKSNFRLVSIWAKNSDGKVDQAILPKGYTTSNFLYKKENAYKSFSDFCYLFTFHPDTEFYKNNIGAAGDIFELIDSITTLDNRVLDQVGRATTMFTSSGNQINNDSRGMEIALGAINDIGAGKVEQSNVYSAISPTVSAVQYFRQNLYNAGILGGFNAFQPDTSKWGREERAIKAQKEYKVYKNYTAHHYTELDGFLRFLFRRLMGTTRGMDGYAHKEYFLEYLEIYNFPTDLVKTDGQGTNIWGLPKALELTSARILGSGSQTGDQILAEDMLQNANLLGPAGRKNALRFFFSVKAGHEHLHEFFPKEDEAYEPNNEDSFAQTENGVLMQGLPPELSPKVGKNQDHLRHAGAHAQLLKTVQEASETGQFNPATFGHPEDEHQTIVITKIFKSTLPHFLEHVLELDANPFTRGEAKQFKIFYGTLVNFGRKMEAAAQSHLEAEQTKQENLTMQERELAMKENLSTREIELKHREAMAKLQIKREELARGQDLSTLYSMKKLEKDAEVQKYEKAIKMLSEDKKDAKKDEK